MRDGVCEAYAVDGRWGGRCTVDARGVRWRWCVGCWGVFNLGGLGEMELLMEEVVDGGGVHAVQMIDQCFD